MANETRRAEVRVIKPRQRDFQEQSQPEMSPAAGERRKNRALAATVGTWVEEFRRHRRQRESASLLQLRLLMGLNVSES
jgi:hypothetical protein